MIAKKGLNVLHFFRANKIHIDCFTSRRDVIEKAPIVNSMNVIPEWWRALPKEEYINNNFYPFPTMKTCNGMYEYYAKSFAIPLWSDLCINIGNNYSYRWQFSDMTSQAEVHETYQYKGFLNEEYGHLKLLSPWFVKNKEDIQWMMSSPVYNFKSFRDYVLAQGLLNFKKQHYTNFQLLIDLSVQKTFTIPFGTPILFTPLSNKKIMIHRHLISEEEFNSIRQKHMVSTFINKYKKQKINNCPYKDHFKVKEIS